MASKPVKDGDNDSGIEDENENYLFNRNKPKLRDRRSASCDDLMFDVKYPSSKSKRGSVWDVFNLFKKNNKNYDLTRDMGALDLYHRKEELRGDFSSKDKHNPLFNHKLSNDSSRTSDVGDSIPSTPASTVTSPDQVPSTGLVGMHNLGNTCYFNSILQCLAHIDLFGEYFAKGCFQDDMSLKSQKSLKNYGLKNSNNNSADIVFTVAALIKSLWHPETYDLSLCQRFHDVIGLYDRQYAGFDQQDAQEFFLWLIDKIHEESVKIAHSKKSKTKTLKRKKTHTEAEQAVVAFASYTQYSQSYIQGLFLSQYRSAITCVYCKRQSNTFDPFLCVSLSIPQPTNRSIYITILYSLKSLTPLKVAFEIERTCDIKNLKENIRRKVLDLKTFILFEIENNGNLNILEDSTVLGTVTNNEHSIYALEYKTNSDLDDSIVLIISSVEVQGMEHRRFGSPLAIEVSKNSSFHQLQVTIRKSMRAEVQVQLVKTIKQHQMKLGLKCVMSNGKEKHLYLSSDEQYPLQNEKLKSCFVSDKSSSKEILFLVAEWEPLTAGWYMKYIGVPRPTEDESCQLIRKRFSEKHVVDLEDCLKLQTQEEKLDNNWTCQFCTKKQDGIIKKLTLWSLPDILVLHLKRFDQFLGPNGKITSLVKFPIHSLNMTQHVATSSDKLQNKLIKKESLRLNYQPPPQTEEECVYDLKAVCNHLGTRVNSGHYTAVCYNEAKKDWYLYDDRYVLQVKEKDIVTSSAYLLFYQRRKLSTRVKCRTDLSISKHLNPYKHWSYEMSPYSKSDENRYNFVMKEDGELY